MQSLADIFKGKLGKLNIGTLVQLHQLRQHWTTLVGEPLASNSFAAEIKNKTLIVHTESSVWLAELEFRKLEILATIKKELNLKLADIRLLIAAPAKQNR